MKRLLIAIFVLLPFAARAQQVVPPGYVLVDSLIFTPLAAVDSTLEGSTIFNVLPEGVNVRQSGMIRNAVETRIRANRGKMVSGYRIRIFFDNKQNSRGASEAALNRFRAAFPGYSAYRSFTSPHFKVTVGDFRTKSEALGLLNRVKGMFPSAFIVKEQINYPPADRSGAFVADTVRVYRPAAK